MVTIGSLWLPIVLSAVGVWIMSFIVWVLLPHHKRDYKQLPDEDAARAALAPQSLAPGQYDIPHVTSMGEMKNPEIVQKFTDGPVGFLTVLPRRMPSMGKNMVLSFIFYLVVGVLVAYIASRILPPQPEYLKVFRMTGFTAWLAYGGVALAQDAIWFGRPWSAVIKNLFDALLYALVTAGFFGWLWPVVG
jgi:hypothetical protein